MTTTMTVPFISIKTDGVFFRAFCDFRLNFEVADEDGEVPRETPLEVVKVETMFGDRDGDGEGEGKGQSAADPLVMRYIEGERHVISRRDIIKLQ